MARGAAPTSRPSSAATLEAIRDDIPGSTVRTRGPVDACDTNGCRVTHRQDARSNAAIAAAETWAYGEGRRAASGEDDATRTTCRTTLLHIDCAGILTLST